MMSLVQQLKIDEGTKLMPYRDSLGFLTIGTGRCIGKIGITEEEADYLLQNDINRCIDDLKAYGWYTMQPADVQDALVNMRFNLGLAGLLRFKRMLNALSQRDYGTAASEALSSNWAKQVGQRAVRIANVFRAAGR